MYGIFVLYKSSYLQLLVGTVREAVAGHVFLAAVVVITLLICYYVSNIFLFRYYIHVRGLHISLVINT